MSEELSTIVFSGSNIGGRQVYYLKLTPSAISMIRRLVYSFAHEIRDVDGTLKMVQDTVELKLNAHHVRKYCDKIEKARIKDCVENMSESLLNSSYVRNACNRISELQKRLAIEITRLDDSDVRVSDDIVAVAMSRILK